MEYPKIIILSGCDIFMDNSSSSFTIRSFIENWPKANVAQIICRDFNGQAFEGAGDNTFVLWHRDIIFSSVISEERQSGPTIKTDEQNAKSNTLQKFKYTLRCFAGDTYSLLPYRISKNLTEFVDSFSPDCIYTTLSGVRDYKLAIKLAKKYNIPFFPHILDDWPNDKFTKTHLSAIYKVVFKAWMKNVILSAKKVFCISELMCKEYEKRYQCQKFISLMHSIDAVSEVKNITAVRKLVYAGSLYLGRYITLLKLCNIIKEQNIQTDITIFCKQNQWKEVSTFFSNFDCIHYGGFIPQDQLNSEIEKADGLLFFESFDNSILDYTRLSLSTKIPEYLASGIPVFAAGNLNQGSIQYLHDNNIAYVATDEENLKPKFLEFLHLTDYEKICERAQLIVKENHLRSSQKEKFLSTIMSQTLTEESGNIIDNNLSCN